MTKYLNDSKLPHYQKRKQRESILDPYKQTIEDCLKSDRYRATWIFERIKQMGYRGIYGAVKNYG
ncbi:MAG: hypothetical protein KAV87_46665 [Desulfobacteraceae bacterium]|nr:hypothetical protein [Desulfobacteraceae bacterium]